MEKKERKERKEKEKDRAHPLVFDPIPEEEEDLVRTDGCSTTPSFTSGLRSGRAKTSPVVFHRETCPLAFFHPFFVDPFLSLSSYIPPLPSLTRDYRGREKLVGGDWISFLRATSACDYRDSGNCPTSRLLFFRVHVWGSWFFSLSLLLRDSWINRSRLVEQIEFVFFPRVLMQRSFDIGTCFWILFIRCKGNG